MNRLFTILFVSITLLSTQAWSDENFCRKCKVLNDYHKNNPSPYKYYDDYLKDVEEKGEDAVNPRFEDLPEDVQAIVDPSKKSAKPN